MIVDIGAALTRFVKEHVQTVAAPLSERLDDLEVLEVEEQVSNIESKVDDCESRADDHESRLDDLEATDVEDLESSVDKHDRRITKLEKATASKPGSGLEERVRSLELRLASVELGDAGTVAALAAKVVKLEKVLEALKQALL